MATDVLDKLDHMASLQRGELIPNGYELVETAKEAAAEIRRLRTIAKEAIDLAERTIDNSTLTFRQIKEGLDGKPS